MNGKKSLGWKSISEASLEELEYIEGRSTGSISSLRSRFAKLNAASIDGFEWGSVNTIAGMSGCGKTTFLNMLLDDFENPVINHQNIAILNFNFEMKSRRLVGKFISNKFKTPIRTLYSADGSKLTPEQIAKIRDYINSEVNTRQSYYSEVSGDYEQVADTIVDFNNSFPEKKIVVTLDHTVLVKNKDFDTQTDKLQKLLAEFNDLKKKIDLMYFIVSQLNRDIESENRRMKSVLHFPIKGDLFGSDASFQHSDMVMVLHRPEMLNLQQYGPENWPVRDMVYLHAIKTRDGSPLIMQFLNDFANNSIKEA